MVEKKIAYVSSGLLALACLVYVIATVVSLNCLADKKNDCAQGSGFVALTCGCVAASAMAAIMFSDKAPA